MKLSVMLVVVLATVLFAFPGAASAAPGEVTYKFGNVRYRTGPAVRWKAAYIGLKLQVGGEVKTMHRGRAKVRLAGGQVVRMEALSHMKIPESRLNTPKRVSVVKLIVGGIWLRVKRLMEGESFQVQTPTAVAGVRGTRFYVNFDRNTGRTRVELLDGKVEVFGLKARKRIKLEPGRAVAVSRSRGLGRPFGVLRSGLLRRFNRFPADLRSQLPTGVKGKAVASEAKMGDILLSLRRAIRDEEDLLRAVQRLERRQKRKGGAPSADLSAYARKILAQSAQRAKACEAEARLTPSRKVLTLLKRFLGLHQKLQVLASHLVGETGEDAGGVPVAGTGSGDERASFASQMRYKGRFKMSLSRILVLVRRMAMQPMGPGIKPPKPSFFVAVGRQHERAARRALRKYGTAGGAVAELRGDLGKAQMVFGRTFRAYESRFKQNLAVLGVR